MAATGLCGRIPAQRAAFDAEIRDFERKNTENTIVPLVWGYVKWLLRGSRLRRKLSKPSRGFKPKKADDPALRRA